jgi:hypothetical protein
MASVGVSAVKLLDSDGDQLDDNGGRLKISRAATGIGQAEKTGITTSAVVISGSQSCIRVEIMAKEDNAGKIYIGGSGVTAATGILLNASDVMTVEINNLNLIYAIASESGQAIQFVYFT